MKLFKDKNGDDWSIEVNGQTVARVESMCDGLLLTELIAGDAAETVAANPLRLLAILFAVCHPQALAKSMDLAGFREVLNGDALEAAFDALIQEVVSFFPRSRRAMVTAVVEKGRAVTELAARTVTEALAKATPEQLIKNLLGASPGGDSGSSPESSASTPQGSLSAD